MFLGLEMVDLHLSDGEAVIVKIWGFYWGDIVITHMFLC
jgi:hypothetical protein